jgi:hypothetical protein
LLTSLKWWPTLAGVAFAAFLVLSGPAGSESAAVLAASGFVYLGAAALRRPSVAWPLLFVTFVVITLSRRDLVPFDATWPLLGLAAAVFAYGAWRGALRPFDGLPLQAIAMAVVGGGAAVAVIVDGTAGALLVAAGLLGHAAWDVYHHRVNKVVVRSMAEFCGVLDTALAIAILVVAFR